MNTTGLMTSVEQLYKQGVLSGEESAQVVFVEGAAILWRASKTVNGCRNYCRLLRKSSGWSSCWAHILMRSRRLYA